MKKQTDGPDATIQSGPSVKYPPILSLGLIGPADKPLPGDFLSQATIYLGSSGAV